MEFRTLGPVEAVLGGKVAQLQPRLATLLAALLAAPGTALSRERLIDVLWPDNPPDSAADTVRVYLHHLRKALGDPAAIRREPPGFALVVTALDAVRFESLAGQGRRRIAQGDLAGGCRLLREALALWRGQAFEGHHHLPVIREEAASLDERRMAVLETCLRTELSLGRQGELVPELAALVQRYPYRERLRGQLMIALHRLGRTVDALEVFRDGSRILREEMGLDPGTELRGVEQAILADDPAIRPCRPGALARA